MHQNNHQNLSVPSRSKQKASHTGLKSIIDNDEQSDIRPHFDKNKLVEYYRRMREAQYSALGTINMSEQLKKKLFGFSEGYYVQNSAAGVQLVVESHPIRGRIIMAREKYQHYLLAKHKERETRIEQNSHNTVSKVKSDSDFKQGVSSQLQAEQQEEIEKVQSESVNDLGGLKLESILQQRQQ